MLNEHLDYQLLAEETIRRNYILSHITMDHNWRGGTIPVPFRGQRASSHAVGAYTATSDVSENKFVRGVIDTQKFVSGTMKFHHRDLVEHGSAAKGQNSGMVSEQSFLKNLPDTLEDFVDDNKDVLSTALLNGSHFASLTADATAADGLMVVDHPERFQVDQKVVVDDGNSTPITGYVARAAGINMDTNTIKLVTARGGSTAFDFSNSGDEMTLAQGAKCYIDGAQTAGAHFTSIRQQILSLANGGDANLFGQVKANYPYLQAVNIDGSSGGSAPVTASNVLERIFDAWVTVHKKGRNSRASEAIMGYTLLGHVMKRLENTSGPYKHVKTEVNAFGWTEITVIGVKGQLKIVGVQEMDDDAVIFLDWKSMKLHTNGLVRTVKDPEGKMYFTIRNTTGHEYLVDIETFGELAVFRPSSFGILHDIAV